MSDFIKALRKIGPDKDTFHSQLRSEIYPPGPAMPEQKNYMSRLKRKLRCPSIQKLGLFTHSSAIEGRGVETFRPIPKNI